jgi:group I intron endonuclease
MDNVFIYCIKDPRDNSVRYIGQTIRGKQRFSGHIFAAKTEKRMPIYNLIRKLLKLNLQPIFEIIEYCDRDILDDREIFWIEYYKSLDAKLLNMTIGGKRVYQTQISKNKIRKSRLGKKASKETREKLRKFQNDRYINGSVDLTHITNLNKGKRFTEEERLKISVATKAALSDPIVRQKLSQNSKGRHQTEETKHKRRLSNKNRKRVLCHQNNTIYDSARLAAKTLGISNSNISMICSGQRRQCNGFTFEYLD